MTADLVYTTKVLHHYCIAPPKLLEISKNLKSSDILGSILTHRKMLYKVVKFTIKENEK